MADRIRSLPPPTTGPRLGVTVRDVGPSTAGAGDSQVVSLKMNRTDDQGGQPIPRIRGS